MAEQTNFSNEKAGTDLNSVEDSQSSTRKASTNIKKHGISFEEAKSAFYDEHAKLIDDPDHSADEERFILLGVSFFCD